MKTKLMAGTALLLLMSITIFAIVPGKRAKQGESGTGKPLTGYVTREIRYTGMNCAHASLYRYTATGFTGATYYDWYADDFVNPPFQLGSHTYQATTGGDGSCAPLDVTVYAYTSMGGTLVGSYTYNSDLCVPFDNTGGCP